MPRPRKNPDEILKRELRITPPNQQAIVWNIPPEILKFVAFEEGGADTGKKLHYHCYIETTMTSQALPKWIYTMCECIETGERGNAVFFSRAVHDHTFGYIAKNKRLSIRHNYEQTFIEEWFKESDTYNKQRATNRKRDQRTRQDEIKQIMDQVKSDLKANGLYRNVRGCVDLILRYCSHEDIRFPIRSQMEYLVVELLYPYDKSLITDYYARSFPNIF